MERSFYKTPKASWIVRTLWKCAGADRNILEKSTYSDHVKYACLGGIVLATGVLAAIAGGYAFYIIVEPKGFAINSFKTASGTADCRGTDAVTAIKAIVFGLIW